MANNSYRLARKAENLTLEQLEQLVTWCGWHISAHFENLKLQSILDLYNASSNYDSIEGWLEEQGKRAERIYNRIVNA